MHINTDSYTLLKYLPEDEKKIQSEILNLEKNAIKIINSASSHIEKIHNLQSTITELGEEIERSKTRTTLERIGWAAAGVGSALLCPLSWTVGLLLGFAAIFGGHNEPLLDTAFSFLRNPVEFGGKLFKRAINSQELWAKSIKESENKITNVKQEIVVFVQTNDPLIEKIKTMQGAITVPTIKSDAEAIVKQWDNIKRL